LQLHPQLYAAGRSAHDLAHPPIRAGVDYCDARNADNARNAQYAIAVTLGRVIGCGRYEPQISLNHLETNIVRTGYKGGPHAAGNCRPQ